MPTRRWLYTESPHGILRMICELDLLPGQYMQSFPLPFTLPQTYYFFSGVFTTGIDDSVLWGVEVDLLWKSRHFICTML